MQIQSNGHSNVHLYILSNSHDANMNAYTHAYVNAYTHAYFNAYIHAYVNANTCIQTFIKNKRA